MYKARSFLTHRSLENYILHLYINIYITKILHGDPQPERN